MEQIFEDYVAHCFRRHQKIYDVRTQTKGKFLAKEGDKSVFELRPDLLLSHKGGGDVVIIADSKWKVLNTSAHNNGISQADLYQLYAYGREYGCDRLFLIYPQTENFDRAVEYKLGGSNPMHLHCVPFDLNAPECSVDAILDRAKQRNVKSA